MTPALANDQAGTTGLNLKALPAVLHPYALMGRVTCSRHIHVKDDIYQGCRLGNLPVNTSALLVLRRNTVGRYELAYLFERSDLTRRTSMMKFLIEQKLFTIHEQNE